MSWKELSNSFETNSRQCELDSNSMGTTNASERSRLTSGGPGLWWAEKKAVTSTLSPAPNNSFLPDDTLPNQHTHTQSFHFIKHIHSQCWAIHRWRTHSYETWPMRHTGRGWRPPGSSIVDIRQTFANIFVQLVIIFIGLGKRLLLSNAIVSEPERKRKSVWTICVWCMHRCRCFEDIKRLAKDKNIVLSFEIECLHCVSNINCFG